MNQMVTIGSQNVGFKEYKGVPVVTFKDIDRVHDRPEGTAHRNFKTNRKHFEEGKDFYKVTQLDEIRPLGISSNFSAILITESGYLMLAKSFTDDKAWQVQRTLVDCYFRRNQPSPAPAPARIEEPYAYIPKFWCGRQVVTAIDIEKASGISRHSIQGALDRHRKELRKDEAELLRGETLAAFKRESPGAISDTGIRWLWVITERGFKRLAGWRKGETTTLTVWGTKPEAPEAKAKPDSPFWCMDVPGSQAAQESIAQLRKAIAGLDVAIDMHDRYGSKQQYEDTRKMIDQMGMYVWECAVRLTNVPNVALVYKA